MMIEFVCGIPFRFGSNGSLMASYEKRWNDDHYDYDQEAYVYDKRNPFHGMMGMPHSVSEPVISNTKQFSVSVSDLISDWVGMSRKMKVSNPFRKWG